MSVPEMNAALQHDGPPTPTQAISTGHHNCNTALIGVGVFVVVLVLALVGVVASGAVFGGGSKQPAAAPIATVESKGSAAVSDTTEGTSSPSSSGPGTTAPSVAATPVAPTPPTLAEATQQLNLLTPGLLTEVVRTPGGYQAAALDQAGHISFWIYSTTWEHVAASAYPYDPGSVGPPSATVTATVLMGMSDATFIVNGNFSGDSSANAIAYTNGPNGWGVIQAEANGNLASSGAGVTFGGIGLENDLYFAGGDLETAECSVSLPTADCSGTDRTLKYWTWNGRDFALTRTASPPLSCPSAQTLLSAIRPSIPNAESPTGIECSGNWAVAFPDDGLNTFTAVFRRVGGTWTYVDRTAPCADNEIPASIYEHACNSN